MGERRRMIGKEKRIGKEKNRREGEYGKGENGRGREEYSIRYNMYNNSIIYNNI